MIFGAIICKFRGHLWSKPFVLQEGGGFTARLKVCKRCGLERGVKQRKVKAS